MTSTYEINGNVLVKGISGSNGNIITHDANGMLLDSGVNILNISGGSSWTPIAGSGVVITPVGNNYQFDVDTSGISGVGAEIPTLTDITGSSFSPNGTYDVYNYYLTGPATINAPTQVVNGSSIVFKLQQPAAGNASLTLTDAGGFVWKKPNGSITLSTDTGYAEDILTVLRIGTNLYASIVKNF